MFLKKVLKSNKALIDYAFFAHKNGLILPDTYLIDIDALERNAFDISAEAKNNNIKLYFMLKQLGRNVYIADLLNKMDYAGAVAVDYREALLYIKNGIKLGHVGHLVQIPDAALETIINAKPEIITVYSLEKLNKIAEIANQKGITQNIMLRVIDKSDMQYSGQSAGVSIEELEHWSKYIKNKSGINLSGITSFPCFQYDETEKQFSPTSNIKTILHAKDILENIGFNITQLNMPSGSCINTVPRVKHFGGTHMEPGHGLTGTTPYHKDHDDCEIPAMLYVSEVSHNYQNNGYCYGGGYYRRGHLKNALVGNNSANTKLMKVIPPSDDSIDYYFGLSHQCNVGDTVVMAFRSQIFVTRSEVVLVSGLSNGMPKIIGKYDALGREI